MFSRTGYRVEECTNARHSSDYPDLVYMDFIWTEEDRAAFYSTPYRTRYLKCGFLTNTPPRDSPLTAIQVVERANVRVTKSSSDKLILLLGPDTAYLVRSSKMVSLFGQTQDQVNKPSELWKPKVEDGRHEAASKKRKLQTLDSDDACETMVDLYLKIVGEASTGTTTSTTEELLSILPRPDPQLASSVGTALGQGHSADPPSRRGETRKSRGRKIARRGGSIDIDE